MGLDIFDKPLQLVKDKMFFVKKAARITAYAVIKNNPQYAIPAALIIGPIYEMISKGSTAAAVKEAVDLGLAKLSENVKDPLLKEEVKDLGELIDVNITEGDEDERLGQFKEVIDSFKAGIDLAIRP